MARRIGLLLMVCLGVAVAPWSMARAEHAPENVPADAAAAGPKLAEPIAIVDAAEALGNADKFAMAEHLLFQAAAMLEAMPAGAERDATLVKALGMRSAALGRLDRFDEAFAGSVALEDRFGDHPDAKVREYVAMAMMVRGMMHDHRGDKDAALASWEQLGVRYGDDPAVDVRGLALTSTVMRMMTMNEMGRKADALALADATLLAVGEDAPPELKQAALSVAMLRAAIGTEVVGKEESAE